MGKCSIHNITGCFHDIFARKKKEITHFRRGTSFSGTLNVFGEDPQEILKKRFKKENRQQEDFNTILKIMNEFNISKKEMSDFIDSFIDEMVLGLSSPNHEGDLRMIPTYVTNIPSGRETGQYLALDLGGTNFRVLRLTLKGNEQPFDLLGSLFSVSATIMKSSGNALFEFIADKIVEFLENNNMDKSEEYKLGFTFSFPCDQKSLKKGILVKWTKGFDCPDIVGRDVVGSLQSAINRKGVKVKIVALVNDTVGTLMASAYNYPDCAMGMIVGTGTNACYVEKVSEIKNVNHLKCKTEEMVINMEWGAYGDTNGKLERFITPFDEEIDNESINPGMQRFEKLISGMYMGEVVRKILLHLIDKKLLFIRSANHTESLTFDMGPLNTPNTFYSRYVSEIETDRGKRFKKTKSILSSIGIPKPEDYDCAIVHFVCRLVSKRAAKLLACAVCAVLTKMDKKELTIGVDGSLYRHHPTFMLDVELECNYLLDPSIIYNIALAKDGSGIGAALAAAAAES
ncbi:hypothetical protein GJ496_008977 [Pomphorhynchus laevis]|nr:hypothetical protein GJ496_008977 [Pomphorhynchus laevis]